MIETLLFDLGNVLIGLDFDRAYRAAAELGPYSADEIRERLRQTRLAEPYEHGQMSSQEFHTRCVELLGLDLEFDQFAELWGDMFAKEPLLDGQLLESLASHYRMVIVSNTNELHMRYIQREYDVLDHFNEFVLSHEVGAMKPAREFYESALETAKTPAAQCVFIDDRAENIAGAEAMGIPSILFGGQAQLVDRLAALGVKS